MSAAERAKLGKMIAAGAVANGFATELWTLVRIARLIKREFGHAFSTVHVWRIIRELGLSSQRPSGRALQPDEVAILSCKTKRWPVQKKRQTPGKNHRLRRRIGVERASDAGQDLGA